MAVSRRTLLAILGATPVTLLSHHAFAAYPERTIRLIVPFAAGGNADIVGRLVGDQISKGVHQTVVVENRGGAGGAIGAEAVARAEPDGYTLLAGSNGPLTINSFMHSHLGYDTLRDFAPIALTSYVPHALLLSNKVTAKTIAEVVATSKEKTLSIGTSGVGSATHLTLERFKAATGADLTHVPYRGGGALIPDVIGGSIDGAMTEFSTALSLHQAGKAHIAGIASLRRSPLAPDIATFIESGVKDFTAQSYVGILAPAKTPPTTIEQLQKAIVAGLSDGPTPERLRNLGAEIATPEQMTPAGFAAFIRADYANVEAAVKLAGIKPT